MLWVCPAQAGGGALSMLMLQSGRTLCDMKNPEVFYTLK